MWLVLSLIAGICFGAVGMLLGTGRKPPKEFREVVDVNSDGIPERFVTLKYGIVERIDHDRNSDRMIDLVEDYSDGEVAMVRGDDNFDGKMDSWWKYKDGYVELGEFDTDWNGVPDYFVYSFLGVNQLGAWRPNNGSEILRVEIFEGGVKRKEYRSSNSDGSFDDVLEFDSFGQVGKTIRLEKSLKLEDLIDKHVVKTKKYVVK